MKAAPAFGLPQASAGVIGGSNTIIQNYCVGHLCYIADLGQLERDAVNAYLGLHNLPPGDTSQINFTSGAEIGAQIFRKGTNSWDVSVKAYHLSNASIGNHNPGLNANLQFMLGYTWH